MIYLKSSLHQLSYSLSKDVETVINN